MIFLKTICFFVSSAVVLVTVSCLQFGELSTRFESRAPGEVRTKTVTGRLGEKVTLVEASDYDVKIVGMIGFPVFQHSVIKIEYGSDGSDDRVSLYDPEKYEKNDIEWHPLGIYGLQSVMRGRVNRTHNAPFVLDTGYYGPVSFYSAFVANHNVLEGRETTESESHTVCGLATVLESTVRVFEIGGQSYDEMKVEISTPGSITDAGGGRMGGTIGREFLEKFDVVFDCPRQRIALLEKK